MRAVGGGGSGMEGKGEGGKGVRQNSCPMSQREDIPARLDGSVLGLR